MVVLLDAVTIYRDRIFGNRKLWKFLTLAWAEPPDVSWDVFRDLEGNEFCVLSFSRHATAEVTLTGA